MKLLFYFRIAKRKHDKMVFLTFRKASKHVILSLVPIVEPGTP